MTEYIVDLTPKLYTDLRSRRGEEIVRCRDCKEFSFRDDEYATADWCDYWGAEVESIDGFCAWGERRER